MFFLDDDDGGGRPFAASAGRPRSCRQHRWPWIRARSHHWGTLRVFSPSTWPPLTRFSRRRTTVRSPPSRHRGEPRRHGPSPGRHQNRSERRSAPRPGSAPPATENTRIPPPKPPARRRRRHCSWGRWPRFPPLAARPHPSRHGGEIVSSRTVSGPPPKSFGEMFGAATGVSAPSYRKHPHPSSETTSQAAPPPL